jgi:hypothetical protein
MNSTWRMYAWSLVALMAALIWLHGCASPIPTLPVLPKPTLSQPADLKPEAGDRERAAYFKDLSQRYAAEAVRFAKAADEKDLRARQTWFNVIGGIAIALGLAAIILSFFYPLGGILVLAGLTAVAVGIASIIFAELLPYLWIIASVALVAIVAAMVVKHGALKAAIGSWKDAASRLPDAAKAAADQASLSLQTPTIRGHMTKLLRKF